MRVMATTTEQSSYVGDVTLWDGRRNGETLRNCIITVIGEEALALAQWDPDKKRYKRIDRLTDFTVDEGGDTITFNGVSEYLTVEVQTADNDARWRIELRECAECRAS